MKIIKLLFYYFLGILGILCISIFPQYIASLFYPESHSFFSQAWSFVKTFMDAGNWLYQEPSSNLTYPILDVLWEPFIYSMQILIAAIGIGLMIAFLIAAMTIFLPLTLRRWIYNLLNIFESIPDLIIATFLQVLVLSVYKATGITIFNIASFMDEKAYLGPILTLSILPTVTMYKLFLLLFEEELVKDYVTFLKGKGISQLGILLKHMVRNIMPTFANHGKIMIWGTLSSQVIIERVFNVHGLTFYLTESFTPMTIAFTLILLFTTFYFFFQFIDLWMEKDAPRNTVQHRFHLPKITFSAIPKRIHLLVASFSFSQIRWYSVHPKRWIALSFTYLKNWKFTLGLTFFVVVIGYSFGYGVMTDNHVEHLKLYYSEDGSTLLSAPPYQPTDPFFFGSDRYGYSLFDQFIVGAKYTLFFGLVIAFMRVCFGLVFGVVFAFYLKPAMQKFSEKLVESLHFVPLSLVAYILLAPVLFSSGSSFGFSLQERIFWELLILTVLVVPLTSVLIGKDIQHVLGQEFITSAKLLGGSNRHIFTKHIMPHLGPRLAVLFGQQFIQVLLIFIHLGVFNVFFGGTIVTNFFGEVSYQSSLYEWSGFVGTVVRRAVRYGEYWYLLFFLGFILAIFAMQLIIRGILDIQQQKVGVMTSYRVRKRKPAVEENTHHSITKDRFQWVNRSM